MLKERLQSYVNSLRPIIYIPHFDHEIADKLIESVAEGAEIWTYTNSGIFIEKKRVNLPSENLAEFLEGALASLDGASEENHKRLFVVLKDAHGYIDEKNSLYSPKCISLIKELATLTANKEGVYATIFIISPTLVLPREIEKMITVLDIPFPDTEAVSKIVAEYEKFFGINVSEAVRNELVVSFKGLSDFEIRQILNYAYQQSGEFNKEAVRLVLKEKEQIIKKSGVIEIFGTNAAMDDVGGLENLKYYLANKSEIYHRLGEAKEFGVDLPKGILIVGMPGCGKSLTAKATASAFNAPLLRLDVGKLMGKYVGESEHNLSCAIKTAEAVAPCVLWIDELEKAFAGVGGGSDITTRLFGQFLTWLQEKESPVYVVATANDISKLPPEFFRKGRFDELFLVDLPNDEERRKIFQIHLKKRGKLNAKIDVISLLKVTKGFSGADIENVVKDAIEAAFCTRRSEREITTEKLLEIIKNTKSISQTLSEKIKNLKEEYGKYDFKNAGGKVAMTSKNDKNLDAEEVGSKLENQKIDSQSFASAILTGGAILGVSSIVALSGFVNALKTKS